MRLQHLTTDEGIASELNPARIVMLVDGAFAVVLTLLVLNLTAAKAETEDELLRQLLALWPRFFAWLVSFATLGVFWFGHHMGFRSIKRGDRVLIWINLLFILTVAFVPFSASLLGSSPNLKTAVAVYGLNMMAAGLVLLLHRHYATSGRRLIDARPDGRLIVEVGRVFLLVPFLYGAAALLSLLNTKVSLALFALSPILYARALREDCHPTPPPKFAPWGEAERSVGSFSDDLGGLF